MKVIQIRELKRTVEEAIHSLEVVEKPIPDPKPGQVLVKMAAAPCNPSDLLFLSGKYGVKKSYPAVPGWEGAGIVVKSGGGALGWWLKGKRVACGGQSKLDGTWAEYYIADAKACVPLRDEVSFEQGATLLINPLTAVGMMEEVLKGKHKAVVQNASLSQVGRLLRKLAEIEGIPLIDIVRRSEHERQLRQEGARHVVNSSEENFRDQLKKLCDELSATIAFDAVAGEMTGDLANAMPEKSFVFVYGALSGKPSAGVTPYSLIFQSKCVRGFWLSKWIKEKGVLRTLLAIRKVQQLMGSGGFHTTIREVVGPEKWSKALLEYSRSMSGGKILLSFQNV
ncbi:putative trans-2-enoyl-CoA reductase,mitochondrial [Waddlia chondrophila 2032/99]|uniref:Putative Zn-dependent oxidoreductase n=2 Tax=Waddlia chondrophila TaxID=71667 RepID=D6YUX4_WADCW|nr:zinc-binding dehydrogenase [Waddlia chondrophila]ADI37935.1 putative Zn-dependent oxidoreductase [Waddlia chondrophila WSU 86-1044]CCB91311.1 putative trans-2-enoyl-CoA reductase,mitochondrial [Waddlia chondrophila 2032/99]